MQKRQPIFVVIAGLFAIFSIIDYASTMVDEGVSERKTKTKTKTCYVLLCCVAYDVMCHVSLVMHLLMGCCQIRVTCSHFFPPLFVCFFCLQLCSGHVECIDGDNSWPLLCFTQRKKKTNQSVLTLTLAILSHSFFFFASFPLIFSLLFFLFSTVTSFGLGVSTFNIGWHTAESRLILKKRYVCVCMCGVCGVGRGHYVSLSYHVFLPPCFSNSSVHTLLLSYTLTSLSHSRTRRMKWKAIKRC